MARDTLKLNCWTGPPAGVPFLFVHGLLRNWRCFFPLFADLEHRWQLYSVDHRGHGQSPRGLHYRVADYVPDLVQFLHHGIDRPAVVYGHSLGAMVAAAAAAAAPGRVRALILEDPPFETMGSRLAGTPLLDYFRAIRPVLGSREPVPDLARRLAGLEVPGGRLGEQRDPVTLRFMARSFRHVDPAVLEPVLAGEWLAGYDPGRVFHGIACPILMFQSDPAHGGMLTAADAASLSRTASDCTVIRLDGVGHQAHWAAAPAILRHLHGFLATLEFEP